LNIRGWNISAAKFALGIVKDNNFTFIQVSRRYKNFVKVRRWSEKAGAK